MKTQKKLSCYSKGIYGCRTFAETESLVSHQDYQREQYKLRVIFFDENRNVTADKSFTVGTNSEAGEPGQPEGILGTAFKVPAASKRILVIANPSVDLPDVGLFNSYDDFNQAIVAVASLSTPSYFMMGLEKISNRSILYYIIPQSVP